MSEDSGNYIYAKTRDFRGRLRDYVEAVRFLGKEVILQSNRKDIAVLVSYERWIELKKKAGELEVNEKSKPKKPHKRSGPFSLEPLVSISDSHVNITAPSPL